MSTNFSLRNLIDISSIMSDNILVRLSRSEQLFTPASYAEPVLNKQINNAWRIETVNLIKVCRFIKLID